MFHIAICDDDEKFIEYIKKIIMKAKMDESQNFKIYEYTSGEKLIRECGEKIPFDLLILDWELGTMNGDDVARIFRNHYLDAVLVFCSGVRPPTIETFNVTPFRYLWKPSSEEQLVTAMKEIISRMVKMSEDPSLMGHYRGNVRKVKLRDILYIENAKRGGTLILNNVRKDEKLLVDEKIAVLSQKLKKNDFFLIHGSCLVNLKYVQSVNSEECELDNGEKLKITRTYQKSFKDAFVKYVSNKY